MINLGLADWFITGAHLTNICCPTPWTPLCYFCDLYKHQFVKRCYGKTGSLISPKVEQTFIFSLSASSSSSLYCSATSQHSGLHVKQSFDTRERKAQTNGPGCAPSITPTEDSLFADFNLEEFLPFFPRKTHKSWADKENRAEPSRVETGSSQL